MGRAAPLSSHEADVLARLEEDLRTQRPEPGRTRLAVPFALAGALLALALTPPTWQAAGAAVLILVLAALAPRSVVRAVEWFERRSVRVSTRSRPSAPDGTVEDRSTREGQR
jgi:hypothetical protein